MFRLLLCDYIVKIKTCEPHGGQVELNENVSQIKKYYLFADTPLR
jgi:hypothetical protein